MSVGMSGTRDAQAVPDACAPRPAGDPAGLGIDPDDLPDGLVVADEHGHVICFNAAAQRITAVPAEDALGRMGSRPRCRWRTSKAAAGGS